MREHVEHLLYVVGDVVEPLPVSYVARGHHVGAELPCASAFCVVLEELVAENAAQLRRVLLMGDVELHDLEDARFAVGRHLAADACATAELVKLPQAPLRPDVARREDDDEYGDLREARDQRLGEDVIALQLAVAPDARWLARELLKANPQSLVEGLDPALESFRERLVVYVRVAYEDVIFKDEGPGHIA